MLAAIDELLRQAQRGHFAVGAFNVYNMEGALAVVQAAEQMASPVILQLLPSALDLGGRALAALCLELAGNSRVPVAVHLDHCSSPEMIDFALGCGIVSIMADGSTKDLEENIAFTAEMAVKAATVGGVVEGELGWLSGEEDGITLGNGRGRMTDPQEAVRFVEETKISALAVCIGNVHGRYRRPPQLDFSRLARLAGQVRIPLVLHGTSGLPDSMIRAALDHGVCKFNVNTELRNAYLESLALCTRTAPPAELLSCMQRCIAAMCDIVCTRLEVFRSAQRAAFFSPEQSTIR